MKAVFVGASPIAVMTARSLLERKHEVVIIEREKDKIDAISKEIDCGFLLGDGSKPSLLRETDPKKTDVLYCLSDHDQTNIIASLVGRSLGFARVVTQIEDPSYQHICIELGLDATIIPSQTIGRHLADLFEGRDPLELSTMFRYDTSTYSFVARQEHVGSIADLSLPKTSRIICLYRNEDLIIPDESEKIERGDEVILITRQKYLEELHKQLDPAAGDES
ncbi:MAG: TrkA family potassium uptake protein [Gammaproteobacteria bacterium]|nr:TrkA family potassium uptake protein [Pseudomonadales bacterium]MCP5348968.1 TrkA family potassium uptake protein [Pseudomonadales bacterium]